MRKLTAAILMSVIALTAMAQNTVITPYSRYGYGILSDNASSMQRSMGGVGYAMNSGRQINVMNPASYAAMDSLTFLFDMGVDVTSLWSKEYDKREQQFGGGLDYITLQVPIMKRLGASVGLLPYSSVGYSFGNKIDNGSETRTGDGSLNQLYLGVGGSPFKGFGVGVNVAYLFGTTSNVLYGITDGGSTTVFQRSMKVRDWRIDIGAQYSFMPTRDDRLTFGVVYSPKKDMHGDVYGVYYDSSASGAVPDTINLGDTKMNGRYSTPETWGAGISWSRRTFQLEADFTYQPWSKAKFGKLEHFETTDFADRYRAAFGGQWQPDARGGYFRRIAYRIGAYWNRDYLKVMGNNVRDLGLTVGFGLPVPGFKSQLNIGIEYRNRRATPQKLIEENYLNVTIGINFNEMWFRKNKLY